MAKSISSQPKFSCVGAYALATQTNRKERPGSNVVQPACFFKSAVGITKLAENENYYVETKALRSDRIVSL